MADTAPVPLVSLCAEVDDPRWPQVRLHGLENILLMATWPSTAVPTAGPRFELFERQKQAWLTTFLELPHGIPSHNTLGVSSRDWTPNRWKAVSHSGCSHWPRPSGFKS